jgi:hypothetical protein
MTTVMPVVGFPIVISAQMETGKERELRSIDDRFIGYPEEVDGQKVIFLREPPRTRDLHCIAAT